MFSLFILAIGINASNEQSGYTSPAYTVRESGAQEAGLLEVKSGFTTWIDAWNWYQSEILNQPCHDLIAI